MKSNQKGAEEDHIEEIINYFAISLFGQNTEEEILWDLARNCISRLGFEDCVIYILDEERQMLVQKAAYGPKNPKDYTIYRPIEIPMGSGIVGSVARTGVAEIIADTSRDPRYIRDDAFRYSEISVPIIFEDKVIGVIDSEHTARNFFSERHLNTLRLIASLCANKLMRARAEAEKKAHQETLYHAQQELSALSLKALRAQMNPHFIFNALNAIQYFITENRPTEAMKFLSLFSRFIRTTLETSDQSFLPVACELEILDTYLKLERMRFNQRFDFTLSVDPAVQVYETEIPVLLIQPFVERILTERILLAKKHGRLDVHFRAQEKQVLCGIRLELREDGLQTVPSQPYSGPSWHAIRERIHLIGKLFGMPINVDWVPDGVDIAIPLHRAEPHRNTLKNRGRGF
ncbi:MAG TPA: histidine kinase [Cyclobacteriaceae bacterium]|nr:histidine kinase [Cyclobacteriaceae bacterium]